MTAKDHSYVKLSVCLGNTDTSDLRNEDLCDTEKKGGILLTRIIVSDIIINLKIFSHLLEQCSFSFMYEFKG